MLRNQQPHLIVPGNAARAWQAREHEAGRWCVIGWPSRERAWCSS